MSRITLLEPGAGEPFPEVQDALTEPNGLLAAGGDLSPARLLEAYRHGIFPWYSRGQPILWWSPDPRTVFHTEQFHIATKFRRFLRHSQWHVGCDSAFETVMRACAAPRARQPGTWITPAMLSAYLELHRLGHAHSFEVYSDAELIGGMYGVAVGRMFFGESMFSTQSNGSKVALLAACRTLAQWQFPLLDAQMPSAHLHSLGAVDLERTEFVRQVDVQVRRSGIVGTWRDRIGAVAASSLV